MRKLTKAIALTGIVGILGLIAFGLNKVNKTQRTPAALFLGSNPFECVQSKGHDLHLTFDDGPMDTGTTSDVLDILKTYSAQATFFIQGDRLDPKLLDPERQDTNTAHVPVEFPEFAKYPYGTKPPQVRIQERIRLLKRASQEGHLIGTHTMVHRFHNVWPDTPEQTEQFKKDKYWRYYSDSQKAMARNIADGRNIVERILGDNGVKFIRLPYGAGTLPTKEGTAERQKSGVVAQTFGSLGLLHIGWNIDSRDYDFGKLDTDPKSGRKLDGDDRYQAATEYMATEICKRGGGIILFHDNYQVAATYLPRWISLWKEAGHRLLSLKELHPKCFSDEAKRFHNSIEYDLSTGALRQCWN